MSGRIHVPPPGGGPGGNSPGGDDVPPDGQIPPPDYGELLSITSTVASGGQSHTLVSVYPGTELSHGTLISPPLFADIGILYQDSCVEMQTDSFYLDSPRNPEKDCVVYLELSDEQNVVRGEIIVVIASHSRHVLTILPFGKFDRSDQGYVIAGLYIAEVRSPRTGNFHAQGNASLKVSWSPWTSRWNPGNPS